MINLDVAVEASACMPISLPPVHACMWLIALPMVRYVSLLSWKPLEDKNLRADISMHANSYNHDTAPTETTTRICFTASTKF